VGAVELMNTVWADRAGVHDALTDAAELRVFLAGLGVRDADRLRVVGSELAATRVLRDALRRLAASVTEDHRPAAATGMSERAAVAAVNRALAATPAPTLRRSPDGLLLTVDDRSVPAVLGRIAEQGAALVAGPAGPLHACFAPGCVRYFVKDHPRREWCGPACGNRARAARHYARVRSGAGSP
jgi:predicted RNA-binding Zn ribbon-like protein